MPARSFFISCGDLTSKSRSFSLSRIKNSQCSTVDTVAERGILSNNDISPKKSPEERTDSNSSFYGHITVESQVGVGTTFHIYLPASDKAVLETEEVKLITGKGRILVMDDEASLRKGHRLQWLLRRPCFSEFSRIRF